MQPVYSVATSSIMSMGMKTEKILSISEHVNTYVYNRTACSVCC